MKNKYKALHIGVWKLMAFRGCGAYRTVSMVADLVFAGASLLYLHADETWILKRRKRTANIGERVRKHEGKELISKRKAEWDGALKGTWSTSWINDIGTRINRSHVECEYFMIQLIMGQVSFGPFLFRICRAEYDSCRF